MATPECSTFRDCHAMAKRLQDLMMRLFEGTAFDRPPRCEKCNELEADCKCPPPAIVEIAPEKQALRLQVENRKRGKQVVAVRGLKLSEAGLAGLLTKLKNSCGAGGTI